MTRYARQIAVPGFGEAAQARLQEARVLVVGAGGLGAPVLHYLVGAGVGYIRLLDADHVSRSNLHRQTLFRESDIGRSKVLAAAAHMADLNPDVVLDPVPQALSPANVAHHMAGCDLVLDCADSFAASYILSDQCLENRVPLISASVVGTEGYVGGFCANAPSLRAVFPDLPQRLGSCAADGVLGPIVGVIGALQAQMALAVLTGFGESPLGRVSSFDAVSWRFGGFVFHTAPEPEYAPRFIAPEAMSAEDLIIDLRAEEEGPLAHPQAHRLGVEDLRTMALFGPRKRLVLACRSGQRSWAAADAIRGEWQGEIVLVAMGAHPVERA
ncbi:HesA/MoeB/ThiF family protein [Thioclava sp. GXIMD4216]|uniref:HesA/MoeB/ThiF family protein n=1 Tax=Thioclava litoralis TaxID=3076557 RepID=A0ABZ1E259_9RHOB|nr:HesA/MoeB/ThiF family protein [Thioclava sp. FTW29]